MRKLYAFLCSAFVVGSMSAVVQPDASQLLSMLRKSRQISEAPRSHAQEAPRKAARDVDLKPSVSLHPMESLNVNASASQTSPAKAPSKAPEIEHSWEYMGQGKYTDAILPKFFTVSIDPETYYVDVERDVNNEGVYRIVNPLKNHSWYEALDEVGFISPNGGYLVINASDPQKVYIENSPYGLSLSNGDVWLYGIHTLAELNGVSPDDLPYYWGIVRDNTVLFNPEVFFASVPAVISSGSGYGFVPVDDNLFSLELPSAETNYTLSLSQDSFCVTHEKGEETDEASVLFSLDCDPRIEYVIAGVASDLTAESLISALDNGAAIPEPGRWILDLGNHGRTLYLIVASYDADGQLKDINYLTYFDEDMEPAENWAPLGAQATIRDGLIAPLMGFQPAYYNADVEENVNTPGFYRIVNPFGQSWPYADSEDVSYDYHGCAQNNHYLYIHAEDPDFVWIESSSAGLFDTYYGCEYRLMSRLEYEMLVNGYTYEESKTYGVEHGKMTSYQITFDPHSLFYEGTDRQGQYYYTDFTYDYENDSFVFDSPTVIDLSEAILSGVKSVINESADAPVEYFNLQGVRIENPVAGSLVIRRQGGKASKVIIR